MKSKLIFLAILLALLVLIGAPNGARAATILQVNSTLDKPGVQPASGICRTSLTNKECTLRAAVRVANAIGGTVTIRLPAGVYTLTRVGLNEDKAFTGDLDIKGWSLVNLTIVGAGSTTIIDGNLTDRVFQVFSGNSLSLSKLMVRNGNPGAKADGGGILVDVGGSLILNRVKVLSNKARNGGGINNLGSLGMDYSGVTGNSALIGGGISNAGQATVTTSIIANNIADDAGGVNNLDLATATFFNSTFTGNIATGHGGGLWNGGTTSLYNVTMNANKALVGYALYVDTNTVVLLNTIIASEVPWKNCRFTPAGFLTSLGNNIDNGTSCTGMSHPPDFVQVSPKLGTLGAYGGPTPTYPLLVGSPAINHANSTPGYCPATDQRGAPRPYPVGGYCDIGAFEKGSTAPKAVVDKIPTSREELIRDQFPASSPAFIKALLEGRAPSVIK